MRLERLMQKFIVKKIQPGEPEQRLCHLQYSLINHDTIDIIYIYRIVLKPTALFIPDFKDTF